jgi:hypothetical protein
VGGGNSVATAKITHDFREWQMDTVEVTQARYAAFLGCDSLVDCGRRERAPCVAANFAADENGDLPVVCVTWESADAYRKWTGKRLCSLVELTLLCNSIWRRISSYGAGFDPEIKSPESCALGDSPRVIGKRLRLRSSKK